MKVKFLDYCSGVSASLCAIHCLVMPMLIAILPALGLAWLGSQNFGIGMLIITFLIGISAIIQGYKEHKKCWPLLWFGVGILSIMCSEFILHNMLVQKEIMLGARKILVWAKGHPSHNYVSAFGGMLIAVSHLLNRLFCNKCVSKCCHSIE